MLGFLLGRAFSGGGDQAARTLHAARSEASRRVDEGEWAEEQTDDLQKWLQDPNVMDYTVQDTPAFAAGIYDPLKEKKEEEDPDA